VVGAASHIAEHGGGVGRVLDAGRRQVRPVIRDRIPHGEAPAVRLLEEDAAVATVEGPGNAAVAVVVVRCMQERGRRRGGDEARGGRREIEYHVREGRREIEVVEEAEQGSASVEGAVAAEEAGVGDDAVPAFADEGSSGEVRGLVWSDAEEDLLREVVVQLRRRPRWCHVHGAFGRVWLGFERLTSWCIVGSDVRSNSSSLCSSLYMDFIIYIHVQPGYDSVYYHSWTL